MDKLHYLLIALLVVVGFLWLSGGKSVASSADDGKLRAWQDCALEFHTELPKLDYLKESDDYRTLYGETSKLLNDRVACENAVQR